MAGDWLKARIDLPDDPAVIEIGHLVGLDEYAVVGRLLRIWGWANRQSRDGHAPGVTAEWIDRYVTQPGFAAAMEKVGWLHLDAAGATFPNFDRHNGHSAKTRALAQTRQQQQRARAPSRAQRDDVVTREEKEKSSNTPLPPNGEDEGFAALLAEYPTHRRNVSAALKRWRALDPDPALQERIVQAARSQARSPEWQAEEGKRVPNLSKWLHNEGWRRSSQTTKVGSPLEAASPPLSAEQRAANKDRALKLRDDTERAIAEKRLNSLPQKSTPQQNFSARADSGYRQAQSATGARVIRIAHPVAVDTEAPHRFFREKVPCG